MAGRIAGLTAAAVAVAMALGPARAAQPSLTREQVVSLFAVAGFPLGRAKHPVNRRRQPANPEVSFVDMNGDGRVEALFIDEGPCYKPDGRWYALAAEAPDGAWRRILQGEGSLHATGAASGGWFVLAATSGGQTKALRYDGRVYASADHAPDAANYPDIEVGGPGTCFPVERSNGHSYRLAGARYDDGGKGEGKPCKL